MIEILLNAKADVNERANIWGDASIWQNFLYDCYHGRKEQIHIAATFIDHGADIDSMVAIKQPKSTRVPIANLAGRREARMDLVGGEMVGKQYATVFECLARAYSEEKASRLLADARANRAISEKDSTPRPQSWASWLMPWRGIG
jgi:hypothetical protein